MIIPTELGQFFEKIHFEGYPLIEIPQTFDDTRGTIINIADGKIGDVALITSNSGSVRANHFHNEDWHLCYLLSGKLHYYWKTISDTSKSQNKIIEAGQLIFTPASVAHKMEFLNKSSMIVISRSSRKKNIYENDTFRLSENYF